jgi:hypothetical protein
MARYHVEAKHTQEQCLADLDKMAEAPQVLDKFEWGCMAGDHTGYATVEAGSEQEAMSMLPAEMRSRAHVVAVSKITPEQIKSFHQQM